MPKGPRGESRPADVIGPDVQVARIAIGEEDDEREATASAAAQLGKLGGAARARNLMAAQRVSPTMAAVLSDGLWSMEDVLKLIDARAEPAKKRGPDKPQAKAA